MASIGFSRKMSPSPSMCRLGSENNGPRYPLAPFMGGPVASVMEDVSWGSLVEGNRNPASLQWGWAWRTSCLAWPGPPAKAQLQPHLPLTTLPAGGAFPVAGPGPAQALWLLDHPVC